MNRPVMKADGLSRLKIERITQNILREIRPEAINALVELDISHFYEQYIPKRYGIHTQYEETSANIQGYTYPDGLESAVSIKLIEAKDTATIRFGRSTIGHECGHCILHAHQFKRKKADSKFLHDDKHSQKMLYRQDQLKAFENPEWQAWEFDKSLLLPETAICNAIVQGMSITDMANAVNLNPKFVETRLYNLGLYEKVRAY